MLTRRRLLQVTAVAIAAKPGLGRAEAWPIKPIHAIVPYTPGGATDIIGRVVCDQVGQQLGQRIVIENRGGGSGSIGCAAVARSAPDGYTLLINSVSFTILPVTNPHLPYDTEKDFSAVAGLGVMPNLLMVSPKKYKDVRALVEAARKNPGSISYASAGPGTMAHLSAERFKLVGKFKAVHVPYKGAAEGLLDVATGRVDFFIIPYLSAKSFIDSGQLVAVAVASKKRTSVLPDVPTMAEAGFPNTEYPFWNMVFAPADTPRQVIDRLHREFVKACDLTKDKLAKFAAEPMDESPSELDAIVRNQIKINADLVKITGINVN